MPGSLWCQEQGGAVHGKVFLDLNNNGIYEPELGERGFPERVQLELIDCTPEDKRSTCDLDACFDQESKRYSPNRCGRSFLSSLEQDPVSHREQMSNDDYPRCPDFDNGGCFQFQCPNCHGEYKIAAFLPPDNSWHVSSTSIGEYRPGWSMSDNPTYDGPVVNNFRELDGYTIAESECFYMMNDMLEETPFVNLIDLGLTMNKNQTCSSHEDCPVGFECSKSFSCVDNLNVEGKEEENDLSQKGRGNLRN